MGRETLPNPMFRKWDRWRNILRGTIKYDRRMDVTKLIDRGLATPNQLELFARFVYTSGRSKRAYLRTIADPVRRRAFMRMTVLTGAASRRQDAFTDELIRRSGRNDRIRRVLDTYVYDTTKTNNAADFETVWHDDDLLSLGTAEDSHSDHVSDGWTVQLDT